MNRLILASGSPRRQELLRKLQLDFDVVVSSIEETFSSNESPEEIVTSLAMQKAQDVAAKYPDDYVVGADTMVVLENQILGKPKSEQDAFNILKMLSGNTHHVLTGVAILHQQQQTIFCEKTEVTFWDLTEQEIHDYILSGEPFDKAGAYGIQEFGSILVKRVNGDYFSVVGLPVSRTIRELTMIGYNG